MHIISSNYSAITKGAFTILILPKRIQPVMINEIRSAIVSLQFEIARLTTHLQRLILKIPWNVHKLGRKEKRSKMKGSWAGRRSHIQSSCNLNHKLAWSAKFYCGGQRTSWWINTRLLLIIYGQNNANTENGTWWHANSAINWSEEITNFGIFKWTQGGILVHTESADCRTLLLS